MVTRADTGPVHTVHAATRLTTHCLFWTYSIHLPLPPHFISATHGYYARTATARQPGVTPSSRAAGRPLPAFYTAAAAGLDSRPLVPAVRWLVGLPPAPPRHGLMPADADDRSSAVLLPAVPLPVSGCRGPSAVQCS